MFDRFLRFATRFERRVPAPVLAAVAGLLFLSGVVGYAVGLESSNAPTGGATTTTSLAATTTTVPTDSSSTTTVDPTPSTLPETAMPPAPERSPIPGFATANFTITPAGGSPQTHCGMLADTADQRATGLMGQENLRGYEAMVFVFPSDTSAQFYMANVKFPLSVAWFDGAGNYVSSADMELCTVAAEQCPRYGATSVYRYAVETTKGGLNALSIGGGSVLSVGPAGSCA